MTARLFCIGLGYTARVLARRLSTQGWRAGGTARDPGKAEELRREGFDAVPFPLDHPDRVFADTTHLLVTAPPGAAGDPVLAAHGTALRPHAHRIAWVGYLSTTGVYGDHGGGWVDEETPVAPLTGRAARRVAAEEAWRSLWREAGLPVHVFRLAGIYGPGRSAIDTLRAGRARRIVRPGQVFSRIHVEDAANALAASMARPQPGAIYNLCDDEPAPPGDVIAFAASLLGMTPPPSEDFATAAASMPEMAKSFYGESKRVRNDRMKRELGVRLAYPTYREGLRALADA